MSAAEVEEWVALLKDAPRALPPVEGYEAPATLIDRRAAEGHKCLRGDHVAQVAYVANYDLQHAGLRWIDLCAPCASWLRAGLAELEQRELPLKTRFFPEAG